MKRLALVLLLVLASCHRGPDAVQVRVRLAPELFATCVALDVLDHAGQVLTTQEVERARAQDELHVALFQDALPDDIQLQARALWGSSGCEGSLSFNGQSEREAIRFNEAVIGSVTVTLAAPSSVEDADGDGFIAHERGGPDCDDHQAMINPHAQDVCDGTADLNCDGRRGCDDATCANQACTWLPTALAFTSEPAPAGVGQCIESVIVEFRDSRGQPVAPASGTRVYLSALSLAGVSFYSDTGCATPLNGSVLFARGSQLSFSLRGSQAGTGTLSVSALGFSVTHALGVN